MMVCPLASDTTRIRMIPLSHLPHQLRQLGDVAGDPPRLVLGEQFGGRSSTGRTHVSNKPPLCRWARSVQTHLRIHKPVAVTPAEHSAPSGTPAEHNNETSTSSSLHLTVFTPLTIRMSALPAEPAGPGGPWSPFGPVGPGGPCSPLA